MPRLSKSRVMASLQCLKRVFLEVNHPALAEYPPGTEAVFEVGHQVGDIAVQVYGQGRGEYIPFEGGLGRALARTRRLLDKPTREPVFEATLQHDGVLVREDVLLPAGDSWRIVEVKASTKRKAEHVQDCAIQAWVHTGAGYRYEQFSLAHIDNQFIYPGGGDYSGILVEEDLTEEVRQLQHSVPAWVASAKSAAAGPEPRVPVGQHCFTPYECPFFKHCWPVDSEYPIHGLKGSRKKLGELVAAGYRDLREVPGDRLSAEDSYRVWRVTRSGEAEVLPAAGEFVRSLGWPRYYLDFETVATAIPVWPGTRPYEVLPFQFSCDIEEAPGQIRHEEFLDMSGAPPMRALAEKLITALGNQGPILMYTAYEKGVLRGLAKRFPDLSGRLNALIDRLIDLYPVTKASYYHPDMRGSWSIKAVLPTIAPDMDYSALEGVHEGTEASAAWLRAIQPGAAPAEVKLTRSQLLEYCRFDTLAMLRLVEFFSAN
jgi:hypothetical protein